mgnify:CR=1 FL=1
MTYAGAYLDRARSNTGDYTDYAEAYDSIYAGSGGVADAAACVSGVAASADDDAAVDEVDDDDDDAEDNGTME